MDDAHSGIGFDGNAYDGSAYGGNGYGVYGNGTVVDAAYGSVQAGLVAEPHAPAAEPTLESRLFDGGFISADQVAEIAREQAASGRSTEEIVSERGFVAPGVVDRLLGRVPPPAIGSFDLAALPVVEPATAAAVEPEPSAATDELPAPVERVAFDVVVTLRGGSVLTASQPSLEDARVAARSLVRAGDEWLELGSSFFRSAEAVAVEIRARLLG